MRREEKLKQVLESVRQALQDNLEVVVIGWMDRNHSAETRRIANAKQSRVRFLDQKEASSGLPQKTGVVLSTKHVGHVHTDIAKTYGVPVYKIHTFKMIREIITECEDLLVPQEAEEKKPEVNMEVSKHESQAENSNTEEKVAKENGNTSEMSRRRGLEVSEDELLRFAELFADEVGEFDGKLGSGSIYPLLERVFETDNRADLRVYKRRLENSGWLVGKKREGKSRVGYYVLGTPALEVLTDPNDDGDDGSLLDRLKALVEEEETLRARLKKVERAKELIEEIENLLD